MNIARKYKISKLLNTPLDDKEQLIIDTIRKQLFLCVVYVDDTYEQLCYCFNEQMVYEAKAYLDGNKEMYYMKHYVFNIHLDEHKIIKDKNLTELVDILYQELKSEYLDYMVIDGFPYPTIEILDKNIKKLYSSIDLYITIIDEEDE